MNRNHWICIGITVIAIVGVFCFSRVPQNPKYHEFADPITMFGVPNFWNVISNLPFILVGAFGFYKLRHHRGFLRVLGYTISSGIILTGLGSSYYHWAPSNDSLVWDRLPMTIVFMSFFTLIIADRVGERVGKFALVPLLALGIFSVWYWIHTESLGRGDLRLYGLIQFYPILIIPIMVYLFPGKPIHKQLVWILSLYILAKLFEHFDVQVFSLLEWISGHSIKHVVAAGATWFILQIFINSNDEMN